MKNLNIMGIFKGGGGSQKNNIEKWGEEFPKKGERELGQFTDFRGG